MSNAPKGFTVEVPAVPEEWYEAATELASYASYAEIVGGISKNQGAIRKWCDKVYALKRAADDAELEQMQREDDKARALLQSTGEKS